MQHQVAYKIFGLGDDVKRTVVDWIPGFGDLVITRRTNKRTLESQYTINRPADMNWIYTGMPTKEWHYASYGDAYRDYKKAATLITEAIASMLVKLKLQILATIRQTGKYTYTDRGDQKTGDTITRAVRDLVSTGIVKVSQGGPQKIVEFKSRKTD